MICHSVLAIQVKVSTDFYQVLIRSYGGETVHARLILNVMINFHFLFQLSLLLAHVCMLPTLYVCEEEDPLDCRPVTQCKVISIAIHYFFTVCFTFMFLEGKAMHSILRSFFLLPLILFSLTLNLNCIL